MRKSTIVVGIGVFIVVTALLCINTNDKMYQKQKHFQTTNEVLEQLQNNPMLALNENGERKETNQFKECLSKRKRLVGSELYCEGMSIQKVEELNEKEKEDLLKEYNNRQNNLSKKHEITQIEPVRLDIKVNYPNHNYEGEDKKDREKKYKLNLILVDEGEGLVIDYVNQYESKEDYERGNVHAQG